MRVLIPVPDQGNCWLGGSNYFRSLAQALNASPDPAGTTVVMLSNRPERMLDCEGPSVRVESAPWLNPQGRADYLLNDVCNSLLNLNPLLDHAARRLGAQLVTHASAGRLAPCPVLYWLPDFQHRHLPSFFSSYERWKRDRNVRAAARTGQLLLSSAAAAADFRRFFPREAAQTEVHLLRFLPLLPASPSGEDPAGTAHRLGLTEPYFFLPNQFWRHKNHRVVVRALRQLPAEFRVVCTGALIDKRGGGHIDELRAEIDAGGLGDRIRMLGVVSRDDLLHLMRGARCVINPSLFEGWSTVVEEAKYLGKTMILSDIPVHREQAGDVARYFDPHDPGALADAMRAVLGTSDAPEEAIRARHMRGRLAEGWPAFAESYWRICRIVSVR